MIHVGNLRAHGLHLPHQLCGLVRSPVLGYCSRSLLENKILGPLRIIGGEEKLVCMLHLMRNSLDYAWSRVALA